MIANIDSKNMPYAQQPTFKPQAHLGASLKNGRIGGVGNCSPTQQMRIVLRF